MNYFINCQTLDQAKNEFRKLCLILHPDKGGNASEFIEMYKQFKAFKPTVKNDKENEPFDASQFYDLIQNFGNFEGLNISFVGSFIWIEGNTMLYKDKLKSLQLQGYKSAMWAKVKKAWYYAPLEYKRKSGKTYELSEIKQKYGCNTFATKTRLKIA